MINAAGRYVPETIGNRSVMPYQGAWHNIPSRFAVNKAIDVASPEKLLPSISAAIAATGLKDGMTISFHHHFRNGDYVMKMVIDAIAERGIKNLTLSVSSLSAVQDCLVPHIRSGVIVAIETSGIRGEVGELVTSGFFKEPVIIRTHGGRARAIAAGETHIDVAFIGAPTCDTYGNINGIEGASACGSMGYAMVDARYADQVVAITDNLVRQPLRRISIPQTEVNFIVAVEKIGDPSGISTGALRISRDPIQLILAEFATRVIEYSGYFKDGFSLQLGSGGASLSAAKFIKERMRQQKITAAFGVGGITGIFSEMLDEGLVSTLFDTQDFDETAIRSLRDNPNHIEMSADYYANPGNCGPIVNQVDAVILSATEVDIDFNVNVLTGSNGKLMGAPGGHPDTAAGSKLSVVVLPLFRGRLPMVRERVRTVVTPGETIDVVVTERGVAVNPRRRDILDNLNGAGLPLMPIEDLQRLAYKITGEPDPIADDGDIVALVEYRDGSIIDVVRSLK